MARSQTLPFLYLVSLSVRLACGAVVCLSSGVVLCSGFLGAGTGSARSRLIAAIRRTAIRSTAVRRAAILLLHVDNDDHDNSNDNNRDDDPEDDRSRIGLCVIVLSRSCRFSRCCRFSASRRNGLGLDVSADRAGSLSAAVLRRSRFLGYGPFSKSMFSDVGFFTAGRAFMPMLGFIALIFCAEVEQV